MGIFNRNPEAVAARQAGRTARAELRQEGMATRQQGRNANRRNRRATGNSLGDTLTELHGQANASAERFFGVADGQTSGGALAGVGFGAPAQAAGGAPDGLPPWAVPAAMGLAALILAAVVLK